MKKNRIRASFNVHAGNEKCIQNFVVVKSNRKVIFCIHRYKCEVIFSEFNIVYFLDWTELDDIR